MKVYAAGPPEVPGIVTVKASTAVDAANCAEYCISAEDNGNFSHVSGPGVS
jgi:hypothetical protein